MMCLPGAGGDTPSNHSMAMESGSLILMGGASESEQAEATTSAARPPGTSAGPTAPPGKSKGAGKDDDNIMIQYRRFQRPQRRDLPGGATGLTGNDVDVPSPACEQFAKDDVLPGDRRAIVFKSPNYPNNYPNNTDCVRRLTGESLARGLYNNFAGS
ncbi:Cubilin, partial [Frankliniella fusca]